MSLHHVLGRLALITSLAAGAAACGDRAPHVITLQQPSNHEPERPGQMTVTGSATLQVSPDTADLTMTISADGSRPGVATAAAQSKQKALLAALGKLGIEPAQIKLSQLMLEPIYAPNAEGWAQLRVATYRAEVTITVTTQQFDRISPIMEAGASAGASTLSSQFRRSDIAELKKKVRDMALQAAKDKALQTASALDIRLGRVLGVSETPNGTMWSSMYFNRSTPNAIDAARVRTSGVDAEALGGVAETLTLDINISYELAKDA